MQDTKNHVARKTYAAMARERIDLGWVLFVIENHLAWGSHDEGPKLCAKKAVAAYRRGLPFDLPSGHFVAVIHKDYIFAVRDDRERECDPPSPDDLDSLLAIIFDDPDLVWQTEAESN